MYLCIFQLGGEIMASSSFRENLIVRDPKKAEEIIKALKQPRDKTTKSVQPPKSPNNINKIWFAK